MRVYIQLMYTTAAAPVKYYSSKSSQSFIKFAVCCLNRVLERKQEKTGGKFPAGFVVSGLMGTGRIFPGKNPPI